jgi:hypothetical protein
MCWIQLQALLVILGQLEDMQLVDKTWRLLRLSRANHRIALMIVPRPSTRNGHVLDDIHLTASYIQIRRDLDHTCEHTVCC